MSSQRVLLVELGVWALLMYVGLVVSVRSGTWWAAVLAALFASPVLLAVLAVFVEHRNLAALVDLRRGSWSFLLGDTLVLTTAVACCALAWRSMPKTGWAVSWQWTVVAGIWGILAGVTFHTMDGAGYKAQGAAALLSSPTKLAHDFVAYPVLFGGLVCVGIPLLFHWSGGYFTSVVIGCVVVWMVLVTCDMVRELNPFDLHPAWDTVHFRVLK